MLKQISLLTLVAFALQVQYVLSWDYRLSSSVVPEFYDISIKPFFGETAGAKRFTFEGELQIVLHAVVPGIVNITLHKRDLNISEVQLYSSSNTLIESIPLTSLYYEAETDKLTVALSKPLMEWTNFTLYFTYTGLIRNGTQEGLFAVQYPSEGNKSTWIILTQLQRLNARTVFPCFDEPAFKARFQLQISRPKAYASFFNTKKISTTADGLTRETDDFAVTPVMSTYLLAFMVAPYTQRGGNDSFIITRPEFIDKTDFAYNVTMKSLAAYNNYTKLPYTSLGNSLFQQATTPSFPYSGMENWGLILYKDGVLVQFPDYNDGWADKQYALSIIVHEMSHMWFGDSVTFAWWSYFWLNEGFARYYQYFMAHELYPEYHLDQQFVVDQLQMIFAIDSVKSSQPMTSPEESVRSPSQIGNKFSSIAYAKGASIIRMFRNAMGPDNFDNAIRDYLQMNHLKNTIPKDLFYHLKKHWPKQQKVDLDTFFSDWTEQVGFPMLTVELSASAKSVLIKQKRFLLRPEDGSDSKLRYTIPITVATNIENNFYNLTPKLYLSKGVQTFKLDLKGPVSWVILNLQQSNYYRVFYHEKLLKNIEKALKEKDHSGIHVINRAQLISDLFAFARIGQIDYKRVFQFIEYMKQNENEYLPWHAAFTGLGEVAARLKEEDQIHFAYYVGNLSANLYERLRFVSHNDSAILDIYNRNHVIQWMCRYDLDSCGSIAVSLYRRWKLEDIQVSPDFRETFFCAAVRKKPQISQDLIALYQQTSVMSEQEKLLRAMGCTKHSAFTSTFFAFLLNQVPDNQVAIGLKALYSSNQENVEDTFSMIRQSDKVLARKLGGWSELANIISDLSDYFTTEDQKEDLEEYIDKRGGQYGTSEVILENALKALEHNLEWADERLDDLVHFLKHRNGAGALHLSFVLAALAFFVNFYFI